MEEIEKHHRKLTLLAATGMMFLLLLGVLSNLTPLGGQFGEHFHTGVSPSEPVLVATANESASDLAQSTTSTFVLPALQMEFRTSNFFFHQTGKRLELTAAVSPRGPPLYS